MNYDKTHEEIVNIKKEIIDIKQSQEIDMQRNREKYEDYVKEALSRKKKFAKVFLEVDGLKTRNEIKDHVSFSQPTVWRAIKYLERKGLIINLEETREGSPIYGKPRWAKVLYIDEYVRNSILNEE